jgi:hypothetical protein
VSAPHTSLATLVCTPARREELILGRTKHTNCVLKRLQYTSYEVRASQEAHGRLGEEVAARIPIVVGGPERGVVGIGEDRPHGGGFGSQRSGERLRHQRMREEGAPHAGRLADEIGPLLGRVAEEGAEAAGVQRVQDQHQHLLRELELGRMLRHQLCHRLHEQQEDR